MVDRLSSWALMEGVHPVTPDPRRFSSRGTEFGTDLL